MTQKDLCDVICDVTQSQSFVPMLCVSVILTNTFRRRYGNILLQLCYAGMLLRRSGVQLEQPLHLQLGGQQGCLDSLH